MTKARAIVSASAKQECASVKGPSTSSSGAPVPEPEGEMPKAVRAGSKYIATTWAAYGHSAFSGMSQMLW